MIALGIARVREKFRGEPSLRELRRTGEIDTGTFRNRQVRGFTSQGRLSSDPQILTEIGRALRQARE